MEDITLASVMQSERAFTSRLIDLYRDHPELWKVKCKDYFNRRKKGAALDTIVADLKVYKPDYTVDKLKQKINTLRTNFNREHKAIESRREILDFSEPSLWYYNDLSFIKDQNEDAASTSETLEPLFFEDSQSPPSTQTSKSASKKRKEPPDPTEQLVSLATEYFKRPEAEEDIIAKGWAVKLKRLRPDQKLFAEKIINDALFEAEMGTLTREGVHFANQATDKS